MKKSIIPLIALALLQGACSSQMLYASGRNAQRAECVKLADAAARERCLKDADMSYDTYQKATDTARNPP